MYRFVAFVWDPDDRQHMGCVSSMIEQLQHTSPDWQQIFNGTGLFVFRRPATFGAGEVYVLQDRSGVILGKLFSRAPAPEEGSNEVTLGKSFSRAVVESRGQHLIDAVWGRYIAFLWDKTSRIHYVLRDPTGGFPCIFTEMSGIRVFMSDMDDYLDIGGPQRCLNRSFITALFWNLRLISRDTGFEGVSYLLAGERLTISQGRSLSSSFGWLPHHVCESFPRLNNPEVARSTLRAAVRHSVQAWASSYSRIVHQLSGGLDSSIVAVCLGSFKSCKEIICVNLCTDSAEGDERHFARLAAHAAGLPLVEARWTSKGQALAELLDAGRRRGPVGLLSETDRVLESLVGKRPFSAVFSGQGGDHLFQQQQSPFVAAEFVLRVGLRRGLIKAVADTSRLTGRSIWPIIGITVGYGLLRRRYRPGSEFTPSILLTSDAVSALKPDTLIHPWVTEAERLPPSKVEQISLLVDAQHFYLRALPFADTVHPLISQPVIDCCLRIPTYILTRNGVRRSLVREAFRTELPEQIATRTAKGGTTSYLNRLAVENIPFLRDFLLDGLLTSNCILDKVELERQLSEACLIRGEWLPDVLLAARMEAWLRSWAEVWPGCIR